MKVLFINANCGVGSTGRICVDLYSFLKARGHEAKIAYATTPALGCDLSDTYKIHGRTDYYIHNILAKLTDRTGLFSNNVTHHLIEYINSENPDIIHLHNLHGYYVNYKILFDYLAAIGKPVIWTLHDCWAFTGHCAHFDMYGCDKWKYGCNKCKYLSSYPKSWLIDSSAYNYKLKEELLLRLKDNLVIVPVSYWLESLVRQSFLQNHEIMTIHNGIDISVFKPNYNPSLLQRFNLVGKKIILGVAAPWSDYKGLPDFFKLREKLDETYSIILVGLSESQIANLPNDIIGLEKTDSVEQLSQFYSIADVFINTTYCDNYPTVNLESISCGSPVITYNTGGSPEAVDDFTGKVVSQGDINELVFTIKDLIKIPKEQMSKLCRMRAIDNFDKNKIFNIYMNLYKERI